MSGYEFIRRVVVRWAIAHSRSIEAACRRHIAEYDHALTCGGPLPEKTARLYRVNRESYRAQLAREIALRQWLEGGALAAGTPLAN